MARSLQHRQAAQLIGLSAACTGKHRSDGPEAHNALTIKPDHPMGAHHSLIFSDHPGDLFVTKSTFHGPSFSWMDHDLPSPISGGWVTIQTALFCAGQ